MKVTAEEVRHALETNCGVWPSEGIYDALAEAGCLNVMMPLSKDYDMRLRTLANLLAQMCFTHRDGDSTLRAELSSIACALSYIINSTSFIDGKYHEFDKAEIDRKLRRG